MSDGDIRRRRAALEELMALPDPPDIRRGHERRHEGVPERQQTLRETLPMIYVQHQLMEMAATG